MKLWKLMLILSMISGCSRPDFFIGTGGKYNAGREEVSKQRGADIDKAIVNLEAVAREDPTYKDTLTLLGRAYYRQKRYDDAKLILQRALVVNQKDEIAWLVLGVTQLRLGENDAGLQSIRGGLTLLSKANQEDYKGYKVWDRGGTVKVAVRRSVIAAQKGIEGGSKDALIRSIETTLASIDGEEYQQHIERNEIIREQY